MVGGARERSQQRPDGMVQAARAGPGAVSASARDDEGAYAPVRRVCGDGRGRAAREATGRPLRPGHPGTVRIAGARDRAAASAAVE